MGVGPGHGGRLLQHAHSNEGSGDRNSGILQHHLHLREQPMEYNASTSAGHAGEGSTFMMSSTSSWTGDGGGRFGIFDISRPSKVVAVQFDRWQSDDTDPGLLPNSGMMNELVALGVGSGVGSPVSVSSCFAGVYYYRVRLADTPTRPPKPLVYCQYDPSSALEEKMWIGFSGSTGDAWSVYYIYNWTFTSFGISSELSTGPSKAPFAISNGSSSGPSDPFKTPHPSEVPPDASGKSSVKVELIVGMICGILVAFLFAAGFGICVYQRQKHARNECWGNKGIIGMAGMPEIISYKGLSAATKHFSDHSKLGEGGFGSVYRGVLPKTGAQVAVKKVSSDSRQCEREFLAEVKIIGQLRHRNVVELMGFCRDRGNFLLVYELLPKGSLDQVDLFKPKTAEDVLSRWKIVSGTTAALHYLHEGWRQQVIHRDVKSSNIMLDEKHNPKLGNFGLARLVGHQQVAATTMVVGTFRYIAPDATDGKFTDNTDAYAFGAVALEIACGRRAYDPHAKNFE